jgi:hypothetical protein
MKIWQIIKKNYFNFKESKDNNVIAFGIKELIANICWDIINKIDELARPFCPICNNKMSVYYYGEMIKFRCYKDKLNFCDEKFFSPSYYEFLGKQFSKKQFKHVMKMKVFW